MRRINAVFLLIVISLGWLTPLLAMPGAGELPACCRRDGKHQCARTAKTHGGAAMLAEASRCPMYPAAPATGPGSPLFAAPGGEFAVPMAVVALRLAELPAAAGGVVSLLRPLRGPPSARW